MHTSFKTGFTVFACFIAIPSFTDYYRDNNKHNTWLIALSFQSLGTHSLLGRQLSHLSNMEEEGSREDCKEAADNCADKGQVIII